MEISDSVACNEGRFFIDKVEKYRAYDEQGTGWHKGEYAEIFEEEYRRHCRVVIDNNGTLEETLTQTEEALRREAYE